MTFWGFLEGLGFDFSGSKHWQPHPLTTSEAWKKVGLIHQNVRVLNALFFLENMMFTIAGGHFYGMTRSLSFPDTW